MKNKKGQTHFRLMLFVLILAVVLFLAFLSSVAIAVLDWTADTVVPDLSSLGSSGNTNFTDISSKTVTPTNNFIQALPGIAGVLYVIMLVGTLGLAYAFRTSGEKWLIALFFGLVIILILVSMGISIIYEDFYDDGGELGSRLQEQTLMSFLILYSPIVLGIIAMIGGVIMFLGNEEVYA